jgi:hypothetical protein
MNASSEVAFGCQGQQLIIGEEPKSILVFDYEWVKSTQNTVGFIPQLCFGILTKLHPRARKTRTPAKDEGEKINPRLRQVFDKTPHQFYDQLGHIFPHEYGTRCGIFTCYTNS